MDEKQHRLKSGLIVASAQIYLVTVYHEQTLFLTLALGVTALFLLWRNRFTKASCVIFGIVGLGGFFVEAVVVTGGDHTQHILGLPVWLFILWGSVGVASISLLKMIERKYGT